jgi:methanol metabolism-related c-type cytochrome
MSDVTSHRPAPVLGILAFGAAAILGATAAAQQAEEPAWEDKPYTIVDGKVDFGTYNGYRRYEAYCLRCHGPDGAGSSYAPALVDSLKTLSYEDFLEVVVYGRKNISASQQSVMPPFGEAIDVMENIDDIYSYLKARADGAVGRGRPERLPK